MPHDTSDYITPPNRPLASIANADTPAPHAPEDSLLTAPRTGRALALDALRGLAILGMVLSAMVPYHTNTLPTWMYHAQNPPPGHAYDASISGITWVDVVFPMFLFALGAAIPLALGPRLQSGLSRWKLLPGIFLRGVLLMFFALYRQHTMPSMLRESYGNTGMFLSLGAFFILFPLFLRFPRQWPSAAKLCLRGVGWAAAIGLLAWVQYADGSGFSVHRHDIIIVILANVAVSTSVLWLFCGPRISVRVCLTALVATLLFAQKQVSWGAKIMDWSILQPLMGDRLFNGLMWTCRPAYQQYLLITLPGTIAGDILADWLRPTMNRLTFSIRNSRWRELSILRCLCLALICVGIMVCAVVNLHRPNFSMAIASTLGLGALGLVLLYSPPARERLRNTPALRGQPRVNALAFRLLFTWGMVWLTLGVLLLPVEGMIKKDPPTFSYLFLCGGLAHMGLVMLAVITDALHRPGLVFLLIDNGQNPMIAYVAGGMVLIPILFLVHVGDISLLEWISAHTTSQPASFGRAIGYTLVTALLVSGITRLKLFWRS